MFNLKFLEKEHIAQKVSWAQWFTLFNIIVCYLISSRYAFSADWPATLLGKLYFILNIIGHFSFIVFAVFLIILFPLSFIIKNEKTYRTFAVILATICTTILLLDTEVFAKFHIHLSSMVFDLFINQEDGELSRIWLFFFCFMPIILLLQMIFSNWSFLKLRSLNRQTWVKPLSFFFLFAFVASHLLYAWADAFIYRPITAQRANLPVSYPMTAQSFLKRHNLIDSEVYEQDIKLNGKSDALMLNYPRKDIKYNPDLDTKNLPNILFVNINGFNKEDLNLSKAPFLYNFQQQNYSFINNFVSANDVKQNTFSLLYGLGGNYYESILQAHRRPVLFDVLNHYGYKINSYEYKHNRYRVPLLPKFLVENNQKINNLADIPKLVSNANKKQLSFDWLNITLNDSTKNRAENYIKQLNQLDFALSQLIGANYPVVIISFSLGLHDGFESPQTYNFDPKITRMPLLIKIPNLTELAPQQYDFISSQQDISVTILQQIFQLKNNSLDYSQGENLFDEKRKNNYIVMGDDFKKAIVDYNNIYIFRHDGNLEYYNDEYQQEKEDKRPPLGLFLQSLRKDKLFFDLK